ncbi:MAG: hypothetical protein JJ850_13330 [Kordiimonadaceae bacterium]|nr:hypothetical protein [Kordiimonadaceae bacterium]
MVDQNFGAGVRYVAERKVAHMLRIIFGLWVLTVAAQPTHAQTSLLDRFSGIYDSSGGPTPTRIVLYPSDETIVGTISYGGREFPLRAEIKGIKLSAVFERDGSYYFFNTSMSANADFTVNFEGEGAVPFKRTSLPSFLGEFTGTFGRIVFYDQSNNKLIGDYQAPGAAEPVLMFGVTSGLSVSLSYEGAIYFDPDQQSYFVQLDEGFGQARFRTEDAAWAEAQAAKTTVALERHAQQWPYGKFKDQVADAAKKVPFKSVWQNVFNHRGYEDRATGLAAASDGGFAIVGMAREKARLGLDTYVWVVKVNRRGQKVWDRKFESFDGPSSVGDIIQSHDGGFYVTASMSQVYRSGSMGSNTKIQVLKLNQNGQTVWRKFFDRARTDYNDTTAALDPNGNLLVLGSYSRYNSDTRISSLFTRTITLNPSGSVLADHVLQCRCTSAVSRGDDGFLLAGERTNDKANGYIFATDRRGNPQNTYRFGNLPKPLVTRTDGMRPLVGSGSKVGQLALDGHGTYWVKQMGYYAGTMLVQLRSGGYQVGDARHDSEGRMLWRHDLSSGDYFHNLAGMIETSDGAIVMAGTRVRSMRNDTADFWIRKIAPAR